MTDSIAVEVANVTVDTLKQKCLISRIFNQPKAKLGLVEILLLLALIVGIELPFIDHQKYQKKKLKLKYKTPIEKATSLLNTLEQKNYGKKEK
jgi:hypothetical protein